MHPVVEACTPILMRDEGLRRLPYRDPRGVLTVGFGTSLAVPLDDDEAMFLLEHRLQRVVSACLDRFPWFATLDAVRAGVVGMLAYQLGIDGLARFSTMCEALERGAYDAAAAALLDSKLARVDAPARTRRHATRLRTGAL